MNRIRTFQRQLDGKGGCLAASAFALICYVDTHAVAEEAVKRTPEVVVSAGRFPLPANQVGSAVTVVTSEDMEREQATRVIDVLRKVPGLSVTETGGPGAQASIFMRGMSSYNTQLLIDGVEMADTSAPQPAYDFGHLLVADIERIEIVRGPQSVLYGGDAIGGTINVITKKGKGNPRVDTSAEGGAFATRNLRSSIGGSRDKINYAASVNFFDTNGFSFADERNGNSETDGYENLTLTGNLGVAPTDDFDIRVGFRHTKAKLEYDGWTGKTSTDSNAKMDHREDSGRLGANLGLFHGALKNIVAASFASHERDYTSSTYDGSKRKFEYQGTWTVAPNNAVVFGAETETEEAKTGDFDESVRDNGYFANLQFQPFADLSVSLGGRLDDQEEYGDHETFRLTGSYTVDPSDSRFHGSLGTGFRAPSLYELYNPDLGNTDLKPEESRGWDFGVEQPLWDSRAVIDLTYFHNTTKNLIHYEGTWPNGRYENVSGASAKGLETSLTVDARENLSVRGTYTFTIAQDKSTGGQLARRPKHEGSVTMSWNPIDRLTTDFSMRAKGRTFDGPFTNVSMGGFATIAAKAAYKITERASVYGRVENLFDKHYQEAATYGTGGRAVYIGVRTSLGG